MEKTLKQRDFLGDKHIEDNGPIGQRFSTLYIFVSNAFCTKGHDWINLMVGPQWEKILRT